MRWLFRAAEFVKIATLAGVKDAFTFLAMTYAGQLCRNPWYTTNNRSPQHFDIESLST